MEQKSKRIFGKLNIIDLIVLVLIAAVVIFAAVKLFTPEEAAAQPSSGQVGITYMAKSISEDIAAYEAAKEYVPEPLMSNGALCDAQLVAVESEPYMFYSDGEWVEDPYRVNIIFTVEGTVPAQDVMTSQVGSQEVRIGRPHIIKTEHLEFQGCTIISVEWDEPAE